MRNRREVVEQAPAATGKQHLLRHLDGNRTTQRQAILAKCYDCMGYYADGRVDCKMPDCALHPWMPYRENRVKRTRRNTRTLT